MSTKRNLPLKNPFSGPGLTGEELVEKHSRIDIKNRHGGPRVAGPGKKNGRPPKPRSSLAVSTSITFSSAKTLRHLKALAKKTRQTLGSLIEERFHLNYPPPSEKLKLMVRIDAAWHHFEITRVFCDAKAQEEALKQVTELEAQWVAFVRQHHKPRPTSPPRTSGRSAAASA